MIRYRKWPAECATKGCNKLPNVVAFWAFYSPLCIEHLYRTASKLGAYPTKTVLVSIHESSTKASSRVYA